MLPRSPDRWRVLSPYLDEALTMTRESRAAWLAAIRARDAALGADLERLLDEHEDVRHFRFMEGAIPVLQSVADTQSLEGQTIWGLPADLSHRPGRKWGASGWPSAVTAASRDASRSNC
jgi:hypothetical protein